MTKPFPLSRAAAQVAAVLGACLPALACPIAAAAQSSTAKTSGENTPLNLAPSSPAAHASSGGASIVRTIVGLAIVIAVIWGLSWILRQVKAGRDPQASTEGLASVAALTLGSGRSVHLVRAGSDYVLIGSAEHGLVPIHRYTEAQAREAGLPMLDEPPARPRRSLLSAAGAVRPRAAEPTFRRAGEHDDGRPDPMRMPSPSSGLVERMREWTVRR
jgi:flagellar protein FliO/FliZ